MLHTNRLFTIFVLVALILSACQPIQPPVMQSAPAAPAAEQSIPATLAEPHGLRPDAPEYAKHGPFAVGYKPLVIGEGTDHPLEAGLWYPALNPNGVKEEVTYAMTLKIPMEQPNTPAVVYGHALLDARVDVAAAPYPLVVFSHGFSTNAAWYSTIIEHYASYGFIILAPEHVEHFDPEWSDLWSASIDRPRDIKQTLDYAEQMTASDGEMAGLIDMQHVAVVGHSYGGYTALAMAGAQYDLAAYNARCAALAPDDPNNFLCAPLVPKEAEMAARAGLDPMPEGLWPSFGDPRVTAIVPMAGDAYLFDKTGLSKITVPMMAIGGTADTGTPYEWGSKPSYDNASSAKKALVTLEGAEHTITTSCEGMPWINETPFYQWICFDPVWDKDRGLDLINHFSTAFLLDTLKGDTAAAKALAPENVTFPGIQYQESGYSEIPEIGSAAETQPQGLRPDAPPYGVRRPHAVGVRNFNIDATKENERPLTVTVWYPALNPQGVKESITYEMGFPAGETPNVSIFGQASENAQPAVDGAPYPLIVHTHGHWSFRQESAYLDEHLASMGFVVISADHEDNWSTLFGPKAWQSEFRRPNEVTREIDYAEKLGADGGPLAGIVDTGRVGVFGWSFGGETALVAGGARLDLGKLRAWCEENKVDGNFPDTDCVDILDHEAELAALAGLNETPQGLWPDWSDERVDAVIGLAPWVGSLSEASLQTLTIPTLLMIGSADTAAGPTYRPFQPYQKIAAERKAEVVFENADHFLYFSLCRDVPEIVALGLEIFCTDPVWDMERGHDLIAHFATAFLLAELKDDTEAATALAPENAAFTGVQYQESGYSEAPEIGSAAAPQPQGLRPDAPTYGVRGMYPVGAREFSVEAGDHTVNITVWYPALNLGNVKEEITYAIGANVPDLASLPISGRAIANATPDTVEGPYPLVVFSPGLAGWSQANSYLLEHLASYGFVVIASDPRGETFAEFWEGAGTRPVDTRLTIDYADKLTATDGTLAGLIDTDHIAVAGHSSGGWTALVGGGAQMDLGWCAANPEIVAENELSNCTQFVPHADQIAAILGLESTPDTLWPPMNDPRVDAVVALAPDGDIWGAEYEGVAALKVPTLVMAGSGDTVNIPERCAYPIYEHLGSANKSLVVFANANHMVFFNQCRDTPWMLPDTFWACSDAVWDMDRGHDLINHFVTAFLLAELKGDAEAATALAAENVSFPGSQYETTGYGK